MTEAQERLQFELMLIETKMKALELEKQEILNLISQFKGSETDTRIKTRNECNKKFHRLSSLDDLVYYKLISGRTRNILRRASISIVYDLSYVTRSNLERIKGFGPICMIEIDKLFDDDRFFDFELGCNAQDVPKFKKGDKVMCVVGEYNGAIMTINKVCSDNWAYNFSLPRYECRFIEERNNPRRGEVIITSFTIGEIHKIEGDRG